MLNVLHPLCCESTSFISREKTPGEFACCTNAIINHIVMIPLFGGLSYLAKMIDHARLETIIGDHKRYSGYFFYVALYPFLPQIFSPLSNDGHFIAGRFFTSLCVSPCGLGNLRLYNLELRHFPTCLVNGLTSVVSDNMM